MSRIVKNTQKELFNKLPQKATSIGRYDGVEEEFLSPDSTPEITKQQASLRETASGSDLQEAQDFPKFSKIQEGVAANVSELFEEIKSRQFGLSYLFRKCRSSPTVTISMLNNKNTQKHFKRVSSQKEIEGVKASREIAIPGPEEEGRRLRSLISLNPYVIQPQDVLKRFFTMTEIEDEVYIIALVYMHRAVDWEPELEVKHFHKLLAGCLLLATKYLIEGQYWDFEDFGFLAGVSAVQLEKIEKCVLSRVLHYDLYISKEEYEGAVQRISTHQDLF